MPEMEGRSASCELCGEPASLYCASDAAFLCRTCDASVHRANFLVARHARRPLCSCCARFDVRLVSGADLPPIPLFCARCLPKMQHSSAVSSPTSSSSSSSSSCLSVGEDIRHRTRTWPGAEGFLAAWAKRLGLERRSVLDSALRAFGVWERRYPALPRRAGLAFAIWLAAGERGRRGQSSRRLSRLEECSRVPRKLILAAQQRLHRLLKEEEEEGWAETECSDSLE